MQEMIRKLIIQDQTLSVDQVSTRIQALFTSDPVLQRLNVKGEILDFKRHSSGHVYFTLGGTDSRISGVMFRSETRNLPSWPKVGDEVIVQGRVAIYSARSTYQVYARNILPLGLGAAARAKEELRKRLEEEGLFDPRLKRPVPLYPTRLAVVTSPTGAALQDVLKVASKRFSPCSITLSPTLVQGIDAPDHIVMALRAASRVQPQVDAVLLVRGGGSRDDLNPFDDERVVRALRNVPVPVLTGLGHEIDLTLSDLAADAYASTPSAVTERVLPDQRELVRFLEGSAQHMSLALHKRMDSSSSSIQRALLSLEHGIRTILTSNLMELNNRSNMIRSAFERKIHSEKLYLSRLASSLNALSPLSVISRGFITCETLDTEKVISSVNELDLDSAYSLHFSDGKAIATIKELQPSERQ